jgi:hypothetical protein
MLSRKCTAQVMLEYLVIAVVVMMAVFVGGPFLVNSIGAHFRIMENNAGDAFSEKPQLAATAVTECICSVWSDSVCEGLMQVQQRSCDPLNCQVQTNRIESPLCCRAPTGGACGKVSLQACPAEFRETPNPAVGEEGRCRSSNGGVLGCTINERAYTAQCGKSTRQYACTPDSSCGGSTI